jgi:hypothetical protein
LSHPNPSHDRDNEYPDDNHAPVRKEYKKISKHTKLASKVGKYIGAQSKLNDYEYGRKKAKQIALSRRMK